MVIALNLIAVMFGPERGSDDHGTAVSSLGHDDALPNDRGNLLCDGDLSKSSTGTPRFQ